MRVVATFFTLLVFTVEIGNPSSAFVRLPNRTVSRIVRSKIAHSSRHLTAKIMKARAETDARNLPSAPRKTGKLLTLVAILQTPVTLPCLGTTSIAPPDVVRRYDYDLCRSIYHPPNVA